MNPIIIIPAYNPPESFNKLIKTLYEISEIPIIIVDDGSSPTINLDKDYLTIIRNENNQGKGFSLIKAFHYAYNRDYTHAVTLDSDNQHDPQFLNSFLEIKDDISIVLGLRNFNTDMPIHRRLSNKITSLIISWICNKEILDSQCGYRRYKLSDVCIESFIENGFQFETEVLIKLLGRNNNSLQHLKISTIYEQENSSMNNVLDTFKFIRLIFRSMFVS